MEGCQKIDGLQDIIQAWPGKPNKFRVFLLVEN